jgi:hypothetical protein
MLIIQQTFLNYYMENKEIIKLIKKYLRQNKTHSVEIKWFISSELRESKTAREIDIINQSVVNGIWYRNYPSHNANDIAIKYSGLSFILFIINTAGGIIGLIGGILGVLAFFK